jgi:uncharacterized protein (TIGR00369 family)
MFREIQRAVRNAPFNALLGVRLEYLHRDGITLACKIRNDLCNGAGAAHGGLAAALADAAVGIAVLRRIRWKRRITTVELKINYLEPVTRGSIFARSHLLRVGATLAVGNVELTDSTGHLVGTALVTYLFLGMRKERTPAATASRTATVKKAGRRR